MNLNFPSRFLRKLEVYQQIRRGQGLAKHKKLWPQEAAFLQWGYEKQHQHLKNFINYKRFKKILAQYLDKCVDSLGEVEQTLGNLYFKGLIDIKQNGSVNPPESDIADTKMSALEFRPSLNGIEIGEVISEINNKNRLLRFWNRYKYNLAVDTLWLLLGFGFAKFVVGDLSLTVRIPLKSGMTISPSLTIILITLIGWPLLLSILRFAGKLLERSKE